MRPIGPFGTEQMILPHHLGQAFGPEPVGQGARRILGQAAGFKKIAHRSQYIAQTPRREPRALSRTLEVVVPSAQARSD